MWRLNLRRGAALVSKGLSGSWAIGLLILVGQASEHVPGPMTGKAVFLAALTVCLTAGCRGELERTAVRVVRRRRRRITEDLPAFLGLWLGALTNLAALAACARALSATMDYIAGWRHKNWIQSKMGPLPSMFGGRPPDMVALVVTIVPSLLFVMGLEHSTVLRLILNVSLVATVLFFITVGSIQADVSIWSADTSQDVSWSGFLTGTALYSFGFLGFASLMLQSYTHAQGRRIKICASSATLFITCSSYIAFAIVLSLMYHFRAMAGFSVPLLKAFEIRDVDWARLVMAIFSIVGLSLALLEVCAPLHAIIVCLGGEDWRVLPRAVAREHPSTGTPVYAILAACLPASILACICPLWLLVQVMCATPLIDHVFIAANLINRYYQPSNIIKTPTDKNRHVQDECDECDDDTDVEGLKQHKLTVRCLKSGLGFLPAAIRGPEQQFYTSLSSPTPHSPSPVTFIDPDNISLVQNDVRHSHSNGTIVTSLSYDSMTHGQMDTRIMTNGSVTSLKSIESMITDQSELNQNGNVKMFSNGSIESSKSLLSITNQTCSAKDNGPTDVDEDLLVMGSECDTLSLRRYSNEETEVCREESASPQDDATLSSASSTSSEESESSTDIDAIVAEYKERIKVATTLTGTQPIAQDPTSATGRRVTICVIGILAFACLAGVATVLPFPANVWSGGTGLGGTLILLLVVAHQPQNKHRLLVPWVPAAILLLNMTLCSHLLTSVWPFPLLWLTAGFMLYWWKRGWWHCRYRPGLGSSRRERIRLHAPPRHPTISTLIPSHRCLPEERARRLTQVDTILISR